ncbi:MAG: hypothetical protein ACXWIU_02305 [Limisphaerales bacterium]
MNKSKITKLAIGFGMFFAYFVLARFLENKFSIVSKITDIGSSN